jgi:hypothetical protein
MNVADLPGNSDGSTAFEALHPAENGSALDNDNPVD